jgi:hypothetical protein
MISAGRCLHDHARLREKAQAVIPKGSDAAASLLRELNAFLPGLR